MGFMKSAGAFKDCKEILDKALASAKGVKVTFETHGEAVSFRHRLNYFRAVDRASNKKLYKEGDPFYNVSEYDNLIIKLPKGSPCIEILIRTSADLKVEEIL